MKKRRKRGSRIHTKNEKEINTKNEKEINAVIGQAVFVVNSLYFPFYLCLSN